MHPGTNSKSIVIDIQKTISNCRSNKNDMVKRQQNLKPIIKIFKVHRLILDCIPYYILPYMHCMQLYGGIAIRAGLVGPPKCLLCLPLKLNKTTLNLLKQSTGPSCLTTTLQNTFGYRTYSHFNIFKLNVLFLRTTCMHLFLLCRVNSSRVSILIAIKGSIIGEQNTFLIAFPSYVSGV